MNRNVMHNIRSAASKIKPLSKNKDARVLFENFLSLSALQVFGMFLPLITLPYVLRTIGISNYGVIVLAASLVNYFISLTDYSFKVSATRDVSIFKGSKRKLDLIYSRVMIVQSLLQLVSYTIITIIIFAYKPFFQQRMVFFLTMPMLFGSTIFPEWFFQGIEKMKYITILNLSVKVFFTICVFIFIKKQSDYWVYALLNSLGFFGAGIAGQYILLKKYKLNFYWLKNRMIVSTLRTNFPIFLNQFLPNLYNNTSGFLLGIMTTTSLLGTYDAIKKIIELVLAAIRIVSRVFFPFLNRKPGMFGKYMKGMFGFGFILSLLPVILAKFIFWYLNITNPHALLVLAILSAGVFAIALYDIFGVNYFIIKRHDKIVMKNTLVSSLIGFATAFPLIHFFGILGAAINLTFTRFLMGFGLYYKYKKHDTKNIQKA